MSVGMMLHNALLVAGHNEWHTVRTSYDLMHDEILVRFDAGMKPDGKCVNFNIPAHVPDPVEYARAKWPEWFVAKREPEQLDLFKQE
jgi:hypothetical protein